LERAAEQSTGISTSRARRILGAAGSRFSLPALTAQLIWGFNVTAMKLAVTELDPYLVGMTRACLAGLILMLAVRRVEGRVGLEARHWPRMLLVAVVGMGLNTVFWQTGLSKSTATNSALISNISPICALVMAVAHGQERLVGRRVAGMALALVGVALVIQTDGLALRSDSLVGDLFLLGSSFTWAGYNVFAVPLLRTYSPLKVTAWSMLLGSAALAAFSPLGVRSWSVATASPVAFLGIAYAILFGTIVAQTLWSRTVRALGASGTMIYGYLSPVLAVTIASIVLGERLGAVQAIGAAFVLTGVTVANRVRKPSGPSDQPA
jgi:drug/metabolite transporter (DMT)-like permease